MFLRLKDNQGVVSLVNLAQAKYIQPAETESGEQAVKIVWAHDTFTDHGEDDLPDEACTYSEQLYVDVTVGQIEGFLRSIGAAYIPKATENGKATGKEIEPTVETVEVEELKEPEVVKPPTSEEPHIEEDTTTQPAKKKPAAKKNPAKKKADNNG